MPPSPNLLQKKVFGQPQHALGSCAEWVLAGVPRMSVREKDDPQLYAKIQEQNLLRQYDLLSNCIEIGLKKGIEFFDKYTLWALNYAAVSNISQFGGRFREEPIYVGNHFPPHFKDIPNLMDRFFSVV